jgi:hypothetical protein
MSANTNEFTSRAPKTAADQRKLKASLRTSVVIRSELNFAI